LNALDQYWLICNRKCLVAEWAMNLNDVYQHVMLFQLVRHRNKVWFVLLTVQWSSIQVTPLKHAQAFFAEFYARWIHVDRKQKPWLRGVVLVTSVSYFNLMIYLWLKLVRWLMWTGILRKYKTIEQPTHFRPHASRFTSAWECLSVTLHSTEWFT